MLHKHDNDLGFGDMVIVLLFLPYNIDVKYCLSPVFQVVETRVPGDSIRNSHDFLMPSSDGDKPFIFLNVYF